MLCTARLILLYGRSSLVDFPAVYSCVVLTFAARVLTVPLCTVMFVLTFADLVLTVPMCIVVSLP
jgi:hypothetical protein